MHISEMKKKGTEHIILTTQVEDNVLNPMHWKIASLQHNHYFTARLKVEVYLKPHGYLKSFGGKTCKDKTKAMSCVFCGRATHLFRFSVVQIKVYFS